MGFLPCATQKHHILTLESPLKSQSKICACTRRAILLEYKQAMVRERIGRQDGTIISHFSTLESRVTSVCSFF